VSCPPTRTRPEVGSSVPFRRRNSVVLPLPLPPSNATRSPGASASEMPARTGRSRPGFSTATSSRWITGSPRARAAAIRDSQVLGVLGGVHRRAVYVVDRHARSSSRVADRVVLGCDTALAVGPHRDLDADAAVLGVEISDATAELPAIFF